MLKEAICQDTLKDLKSLSGEIKMNETMFRGKRPGKHFWGVLGKNIVFGNFRETGKYLPFLSHPELKRLYSLILTNILKQSVNIISKNGLPIPPRRNHVVVLKDKGILKDWDHLNSIEVF